MPTHLFLAPAAGGKTTYVLQLVQQAARGLRTMPRVVVPSAVQARAFKKRLAQNGGAIGVRVLTFDHLYAEILNAAGETYTELVAPVQFRLLRAIVNQLPLAHFASLKDRPGFIQALQAIIAELKAARILPAQFQTAVRELGDEPRLVELAMIYAAYQNRLREHNWADLAGIAWLTADALQRHANLALDWSFLVVDGFDNFTEVQLAILQMLSQRVNETIVTLTGVDDDHRDIIQRRFNKTRARLETILGVAAEKLPHTTNIPSMAIAHLEANLFRAHYECFDCGDTVQLIEAPDRASEVRAALRWLKQCILAQNYRVDETALLARSLSAYRPFILQIAAEFGLPIRLLDGILLRSNPAIAALIDLLRLMLPGDDGQPALPMRLVIQAWRSPYFDWQALPTDDATQSIGIEANDAERLDIIARWARVIGGVTQWLDALDALAHVAREKNDDDERAVPANVPLGADAQSLLEKFQRFTQRLTPPKHFTKLREYVGWLETIIGPDPTQESSREEPTSLQIVAQIRDSKTLNDAIDIAALQTLKDVLRGLVWAEEAVADATPVTFQKFFDDLLGAIDATSFEPPFDEHQSILVSNVIQARGVSFRAVAVLGLAESEFPAMLSEDPFLRETDRQKLRDQFGFALNLATESNEAEFFYETITRPSERLLITRPRLADNGAEWQASPYWENVKQLVHVTPRTLTTDTRLNVNEVASWAELMENVNAANAKAWQWAREKNPARVTALEAARQIINARQSNQLDGDAREIAGELAPLFQRTFSASRLEQYRTCPYFFWFANILRLEARTEPSEGLDARQLGNLYHQIFQKVFDAVADKSDLNALLAALPGIAQKILEDAPTREGFRQTAWWQQTRAEIIDNVKSSLEKLRALADGFVPAFFELWFDNLILQNEHISIRLQGVIDRIDRTADGRLRIIDYKTSSPSQFEMSAVMQAKKIQLPLYALAARDVLKLGPVADGFYWHIQKAEPSGFQISKYAGGLDALVNDFVRPKILEAVQAMRAGNFAPAPPDDGCPGYCPASAFCWRYRPGFRS